MSKSFLCFTLFFQLFLDNVEAFVHQVESVNFINLFLSDLKYVELLCYLFQ